MITAIDEQSVDIALGVDEALEMKQSKKTDKLSVIGAGDQGMMFGYASAETEEYMPYAISLAHKLAQTGNGIIEATWRNTLCFTPCSVC